MFSNSIWIKIMETLLEKVALENILRDFRQELQYQVPLELRHCTYFLDTPTILELAKKARANAYEKFWKNLIKLENPGEEVHKAIFGLFGSRIQAIINDDFVAKHEGFSREAEALMSNQADTLCLQLKTTVDTKLHPTMNLNSLEKFLEDTTQQTIGYFECHWSHGNVTLFGAQKENLKKKLDDLKQEVLANHQHKLQSDASGENGQKRMSEAQQKQVRMEATSSLAVAFASGSGMPSQQEGVRKRRRIDSQIQESLATPAITEDAGTLKRRRFHDSISLECSTSEDTVTSSGGNDTLIFFVHQESIEMSILINGSYQCHRDHRECSDNSCANIRWIIKSNLGVDEDGQLKCDEDEYTFSLQKLLQETSSIGSTKISFKVNREKVTQEFNIEVLLGFLLKTLRDSAEVGLRRKVSTAIIMIPACLTSFQRVQFKDAAVIAGFDNVHLLNEESTAVYTYASEKLQRMPACFILIIGHNFKTMSAMLYAWNGVDLLLIADSHFDMNLPLSRLYVWIEHFLSVEMQHKSNGTPRKALFLPGLHLANKFTDIIQKFGFVCELAMQDEFGYGGSILEEKSVEKIQMAIRNYSLGIISYCHDHDNRDSTCHIFQRQKCVSTSLVCEMSIEHFQHENKLDILQYFSRQSQHHKANITPLGQLEFKGNCRKLLRELPHLKCLKLILCISKEGIVSLDPGSLELVKKSEKNSKVSVSHFEWSAPNLGEEERGKIADLVRSIFREADISSFLNASEQASIMQNRTINLGSP